MERVKEPWDEEILPVIPSAQCDESWGERGKGLGDGGGAKQGPPEAPRREHLSL